LLLFVYCKQLMINYITMKKNFSIIGITLSLLLINTQNIFAQDSEPWILEITTSHWNMDKEDYSLKEWKALEKEYHEKVTMKNEFIKGAETLIHSYSPDNSEIVVIKAYENWEDLDKSADKEWELIKAAWPDSATRVTNFRKMNDFYSGVHSDEIYSTLTLPKFVENRNDTTDLVFYIRKTHSVNLNKIEGGTNKERRELRKEYLENVVHKNPKIRGYYPMRHLYGSDSRDLLEIFIYDSLKDLVDKDDNTTRDLVMAHWPEKEARNAFFKNLNKYESPWHGDWIYSNVPELHK
jgi:hypothetical protein